MSSRAEKFHFNMDLICPTDMELLRLAEKQHPTYLWPKGAGYNISREDLNNWGFLTLDGVLTPRGKQLLEAIDATLKAH